MKAITLTQPWATLVAIGAKRIETRSWSTSYRGPIAIHAAAGLGPVGGRRGLYELCMREPFYTALDHFGYGTGLDLPLGAIVAVARIGACLSTNLVYPQDTYYDSSQGIAPMRWPPNEDSQEYAFGDYSPGRYGFVLLDVHMLSEPIPCRGALSLWTVPPEIESRIAADIPSYPPSQRAAHASA